MVVRQAPIFRCTNWGTGPPASAGTHHADPSRTLARSSSRSYRAHGSGAGGLHSATTRSYPQEEAAKAAIAMETTAAASDDEAGPSPAEPAAEGAAAMAEAAVPEAAEVAEITAPEAAEAAAPEAAEAAEATAPGVAEVASSFWSSSGRGSTWGQRVRSRCWLGAGFPGRSI
jgi:hypothetical protein